MFNVRVRQCQGSIVCQFNELCDALKYIEITMEVCEKAVVVITEEVEEA